MLRHVRQRGAPLLGRSRACRRQALPCQAPIFFRLAARHRHHLVGPPADQRGRSLLVPEGGPVVVAPRRYGPPYGATAAGAAASPGPEAGTLEDGASRQRRAILTRCHRRLQALVPFPCRSVPAPVAPLSACGGESATQPGLAPPHEFCYSFPGHRFAAPAGGARRNVSIGNRAL